MNPSRLARVQFTPILLVENLVSILSLDETAKSNFKIFTTFDSFTWFLLILSILMYSLFNMKKKTNFIYEFIISIINHFECLITKQSMFNALSNLINNFFFFTLQKKLVHFHQTKFITLHMFFGFLVHFLSWLYLVMICCQNWSVHRLNQSIQLNS